MTRVLLDTHTFLWLDAGSRRLSPRVRDYLEDPETIVYLSVVTPWEMMIKWLKDKLPLRTDVDTIVAEQLERNPLQLLNVRLHHVRQLPKLNSPRGDPFDRMLAAQCLALGATLLTCDPVFQDFPILTDW